MSSPDRPECLTLRGLLADADAAGALINNTISGASKGVQLLDETPSDTAIPTATLQLNSIAGNTVGVDNSTPAQVDATTNWWGSSTGPSGASNPGGTGDSMSGNIGFDPWLCDGTDTSPATGFQPNPDTVCGGAAPDTSITSQPANPSSSTTATFAFAGTDGVTPPASLAFECQLDGAGFTVCTSAKIYTGIANGSHTFQVRSRDAAGNVDTTPASYTWAIAVAPTDTTPPNTTIVSGPPSSTSSAMATFTFNGADNVTPPVGLTFECRLDGAAFAACTSPKTYSGLQNGPHTFQVHAKDAADNVDPAPATYNWTIKLSHSLYLPLIQR